jgi:tetratricopeptide (TPR) repeat protein
VSELQQQEESLPSPDDAQTHYDLGIAYKEMGLLDDAIRELKMAARDPGRRVECLAVLGICYCEQGKPEEALGMFEQCLALGGRTGKGAAGILYEMGLVHEEAGNATEALECYGRVAEIDSNYRETRARMARLRAAGPGGPPEPTRGGRSKRISYL